MAILCFPIALPAMIRFQFEERRGKSAVENKGLRKLSRPVFGSNHGQVTVPITMSLRVANQVKKMQGLVRYALKAHLPRRHFWTFTVWKDRNSVNAFVTSEPHNTAVRKFTKWAGRGAAFVEWNSADSSINWEQALERLKTPTFYHKPPATQI